MKTKQPKQINRYNLLKNNETIIKTFIRNGILSYMMIRDIEIYENYLQLDNNITKELKYILLSDTFELSTDRIRQIIANMESITT